MIDVERKQRQSEVREDRHSFFGADSLLKADGSAEYTPDLTFPRLLHGKVLRSAHAHARILRIDVEVARRLPGVRAVLTAADLPPTARRRLVLAEDRVLCFGDALCLVAATSEAIARQALRLVEVEYEPLPGVFDLDSALDPASPTLWPGRAVPALPPDQAARMNNVASYGRIIHGDAERGFAESDVVVEEEYETPLVHQGNLETRAAVAMVDSTGKMHVWASNQMSFGVRGALANVLGVPTSKVAVVTPFIGGGFGGKTGLLCEHYAAFLALATRQPVRVVNSRAEEFFAGSPRPATRVRIKTGARRDGTILARKITAFADGGPTGTGWSARIPILALGPYRIPNVFCEAYDVFTNNVAPGACRAPAAPPSVFAGEGNIDALARALGMDPVELRVKNAWRDGDETATGQRVEHAPVAEAIRTTAARIGWGSPLGPNRGRGIAAGWWQSGPGNSTVVLLLNSDGSAQLITGAVEQGPGSTYVGLPLMVSSETGIPPERVEVVRVGTDQGPNDMGSGGSRVTVNLGLATQKAARDLGQQILERAAAELDVPVERLICEDWRVRDPETGASVPIPSIAATAYASGQLVGRGSHSSKLPPHDHSRIVGNIWPGQARPAYFAQAAEVEVDRETGQVRVLRIAATQDVGFAMNRLAIEGQIQGGMLQGLGQAVYEEMTLREGRVTNADFGRYAMPTALDAPELLVDILESRKAEGFSGVKGVGEAPSCTTPAAVGNAVRDSLGVAVRRLPLSGENVLEALDRG